MIEILSRQSLSSTHFPYRMGNGQILPRLANRLVSRDRPHFSTFLQNRTLRQLQVPNLQVADFKKNFIHPYKMTDMFEQSNSPTPTVGCIVHKTANILGPKIAELLDKTGAKVKKININFDEINVEQLQTEVALGIAEILKSNPDCVSIPEELLKNAQPGSVIAYIRDWAEKVIKNSHGIALPGGSHVETEFYDKKLDNIKRDYRRSMTEFALIAAAKKLKKPVIGTCRGAQILNVFFGGTLKNLKGAPHIGWQQLEFTDSSRKTQLEKLFERSPPQAYSHHFQICDKIAPNFEVVMTSSDKAPKLIISKKEGYFIGIQFHPEKDDCDLHPDIDDSIILSLLEENPDPSFYTASIRVYDLFYRAMFRAQSQVKTFGGTL